MIADAAISIQSWAIEIIATIGLAVVGALLTFVASFGRLRGSIDALTKAIDRVGDELKEHERRLGVAEGHIAVLRDRGDRAREDTSPGHRHGEQAG